MAGSGVESCGHIRPEAHRISDHSADRMAYREGTDRKALTIVLGGLGFSNLIEKPGLTGIIVAAAVAPVAVGTPARHRVGMEPPRPVISV
jgi:hypothetical protein